MGRDEAKGELKIRRLKPRRDRKALMRLARGLREWFDEGAYVEMNEDLSGDPGLVAERDGTRVGFLTYWTPASVPGPDRYEITWIAVARSARGEGVGQALIAALVAQLREEVGPQAQLLVWTYAESAPLEGYRATRGFYERCGFRKLFTDRRDLDYWEYERLFLIKDVGRARQEDEEKTSGGGKRRD